MNSNLSGNASVDLAPLGRIVESFASVSSNNLIPILQQIQTEYGYLPRDVLMEMSRPTGIAASQIYGVATFYEQFCFEPRGRHIVRCCRGTACHVREGKRVINTVKQELNVEEGQTTDDMEFTFETVACLGVCALAPVTVIDSTYYGKMTPRRARTLLAGLRAAREEID